MVLLAVVTHSGAWCFQCDPILVCNIVVNYTFWLLSLLTGDGIFINVNISVDVNWYLVQTS